MDFASFLAALAGAILFGVAAYTLSTPMRKLAILVWARWAVTTLAAIAGAITALAAFDQFGGRMLQVVEVEDSITAKMEELPFVQRVFRDFPEKKDEIRARAAEAFREGGQSALDATLEESWGELGFFARVHYLPRARDEDLLRFVASLTRLLRALGKSDPQLCYRWMTPSAGGPIVTTDELADVVGRAPVLAYEEDAARLIEQAHTDIPAYDPERSQAIVASVGQDIVAKEGVEGVAILSGTVAVKSDDQARLACRTAAELYERLTQFGPQSSAAALRHVLKGEEPPLRQRAE
ncbi:MAG: hypothetical protein GC199_01455 [Alphaproteobacteria bacterium]|nr:hypothetical protein [Alphaproteobacteria bacterium]